MLVDLHIHTNATDGTWDRHELIEKLLESNIDLFSITDHDTIENSGVVVDEWEGYDLRFMIGVEISCTYMDKTYHLTAYSFHADNSSLLQLLEENGRVWDDYNTGIIRLLEADNPSIDYSKYKSYQYKKNRGGCKSWNFLLDLGLIKDLPGYRDLLERLGNKPIFKEPEAIINAVKKAQGLSFLAHPNAYFHGADLPIEQLKKWIDFGIPGIECYSSYPGLVKAEDYVSFCKKHNLLISGGSDCHGTFLRTKLGNPRITLDMLNLGSLFQEPIDFGKGFLCTRSIRHTPFKTQIDKY